MSSMCGGAKPTEAATAETQVLADQVIMTNIAMMNDILVSR